MASSMGGMFPGQQAPGQIPVGGPGGPNQPGFPGPGVPGLFASLVSQDYVNGTDQEEIRTGVDQCIQKFLDVARQTECFFLQKRLQLSVQKPEQVVKRTCQSYGMNCQRKEMLVQKHLAKLHHWQQVLEDVSGQQRKPTDLPHRDIGFSRTSLCQSTACSFKPN
ncbi:hypothetical protein WMY93_005517 [Mugilogobius chulae]|uniref:Mediator of RNA polymerase II transcription subunit 28 n=1 Tax=Mugilogobius chulae TaxID=88201 RepID=A0AAW0PHB1_9GOBI